MLALPVPRYLGQISYGTYLWHWPVVLSCRQVFDISPLVLAAARAGGRHRAGRAVLQVLEMPVRRARSLHACRLAGGRRARLATSVARVRVRAARVLELDRRPALRAGAGSRPAPRRQASTGRCRTTSTSSPPRSDTGAPEHRCCTVDDPEGCTLVGRRRSHVLLLGDSQARMFAPAFQALARDHDFTLSMNIRSACAWQVDQDNLRGTGEDVDKCRHGPGGFYTDVLPLMDVDLVVAVGLSRSESYWENKVAVPDAPRRVARPSTSCRSAPPRRPPTSSPRPAPGW